MDHGTNAIDILSGRVYPLKLGFIGVVNRSQQDIQGNKPMEEALKAEMDFFRHHPAYRNIASRCGTEFLAKTLNTTLMSHIRERLPDIKARLNTLMGQTQQELASYGDHHFHGKEHRGSLILQLMTRFANSFISSIDGTSTEISTKELCGGARIYYIFNSVFGSSLESIDPTSNLTALDIRTAIRNSTGPRPSLFVPEMAFDLLVKPQIKLLEMPSQRCVELVYEELIKICHTCGSTELTRFPRLQAKLIEVVSDLLRERLGPASSYVESLIAIQRAYINTNHPNFLGAAAAMSSVVSSKQERERKRLIMEERERREKRRLKELNQNGVDGTVDEDEDGVSVVDKGDAPTKKVNLKNGRSLSPGVNGGGMGAATLNGLRSASPAPFNGQLGGAKDTFLHYFFGKDGANAGAGAAMLSSSSSRLPDTVNTHAMRRSEDSRASMLGRTYMQATAREEQFDMNKASPVTDPGLALVRNPVFCHACFQQCLANTQLLQSTSCEPALTEREAMETDLIRALISSYFNIVRESIADQVPKAIMHLLVNYCKDVVQNRLVSELYRENMFEDLLYEDDGVKKEREKCEKLLQTYREAAKIIGEVL